MKYTAKKLIIRIAVLGIFAAVVTAAIALFCISGIDAAGSYIGITSSLVNSETVYIMLALWIAVPIGLMALIAAVVVTARPITNRPRGRKVSSAMSLAMSMEPMKVM